MLWCQVPAKLLLLDLPGALEFMARAPRLHARISRLAWDGASVSALSREDTVASDWYVKLPDIAVNSDGADFAEAKTKD